MIRDAETEDMLADFSRPIFQQAGLSPDAVRFVLVQDKEVNAFVAGGLNIFIYTGLLQLAKTPDELIGVIAHETGHIADGHLVRTTEAMRHASAAAILSTLAGVAVAVGAKDGQAGAAAVALGQQVAQRSFLQYSRTQEASADQAALRFLAGAAIPAEGMHDFLQRLEDQELLPEDQQSEFVRTHPLTRDRVEAVAAAIDNLKGDSAPLPDAYRERFARVKAKLDGFIDPRGTLQRYDRADPSFSSRYARAIAYHLTGDLLGALALIREMEGEEPSNPYLRELEGQILYESGRIAESLEPYRRSVELSKGNALLRIGYAQALLNTNSDVDLREALVQLEAAVVREDNLTGVWRLLATAYGRKGEIGLASYALAEEALLAGDTAMAKQQAQRAQSQLEKGSSGWIKAGDVLKSIEDRKGGDSGSGREK